MPLMRILPKSPKRVVGLLLCTAAVSLPFYLWNATQILMSAKRTYTFGQFQRRECQLTIRVHRFRPITEFEVSTDSHDRIATDHYTFGAFTVDKITGIEWFPQHPAVSMSLDVELDSENVRRSTALLYDFERGCILSPVHGKTPEGQLAEIAAAFRSAAEVQYSSTLCMD